MNSMSDLFHPEVPLGFIRDVFDVIADTPRHTYQVLTKRSKRLAAVADSLPWPENLWMGVSVENDRYTFRIDHLRQVGASVRFLSCEPLLGAADELNLDGIHWVIAGGESGGGARLVHPDWVRSIRDQCGEAGVAFFFKQWGGRTPKARGRELDGATYSGPARGPCFSLSAWQGHGGFGPSRSCSSSMTTWIGSPLRRGTRRTSGCDLDLFGGAPENLERLTLNPIDGSARVALDTGDPPFTRLRFFEMPPKAVKLRQPSNRSIPVGSISLSIPEIAMRTSTSRYLT